MRKWVPLLIVAVAVIASLVVFQRLPSTVPTHWSASGVPDGFSSRAWGAFVSPVMLLGLMGVMWLLPRIDPRAENYAKFAGTYDGLFISIMLVVLVMHFVVLASALGYPVAIQRWLPFTMGAFFIVLGNLLPRVRPNWFFGIRTPWTLSSDRVWEKTHRLGGYLFVILGIIILLAGGIASRMMMPAFGALIGITALTLVVYSYVEWKRERGPGSRSST
jgi:uncharacterized membrane protein